jgi:O-antigen ligase
MSAVVQSVIIAIIGLILAVILGSQLGNGYWVPAIVVIGAGILFGAYKLFFKAIRVEALILGFLIFGYIVGNRGFAQLTLTRVSPVYLGEAGMLACLGILGARLALNREQIFPKTQLSWAILAFIAIGAVRLYFDLFLGINSRQPLITLRDSAVVYYALFFFIAYKVGSDPVGRRLLERCVLIACIVLLPVFIIQFIAFPDLFNRITVRGYPLISQKGDLTTTYLAFASFYFFLKPAKGLAFFLLRTLSVVFFVGMLMLMARAALFGCACAAVLLLLARRPQFVFYQMVIGVAALILIGLLQVGEFRGEASFVTRLTDRVKSMTDISGTRNYRGTGGDSSYNNNQFRLVWWGSVFNETISKSPLFGLGFGYDLTAGFMRAYFPTGGEDTATTRSPHSVWMTVLGRMGLVGFLSFALIVLFTVREAVAAARRVARRKAEPFTLAFWTGVLIILGSASFGVVLEGPMGGVLFWSFLGLASSQLHLRTSSNAEPSLEAAKKQIRPERRLVSA